jgi:Zn-dependent metalloprotease
MVDPRRERGQVTVSYAGALAVVAIVFGVLTALDLDGQVRATVNQALCTIFSGTDCGEPQAGASGYADDPYEDSGDAEREIYDAACTDDGGDDPARDDGEDPTGDEQVDEAYGNLGRVYDYYADTFGHDSYDGDGAPVVGTVNFCEVAGVAGGSSFWDGDEINFAPGAGDALDTAAHEFTHGVIDHTADLDYECQSGALNESIADMIAWNLDPEDTTYGEDRDSGPIRDYRDPTLHGQPGHVDDYVTSPNTGDGDWGGVHTNSGIPNRAYHELVRRVGREHAEQILWRALTEHLDHDSGFEDYRTAMLQAARELYGEGEDYDGVDAAFAAVGLDGTWEAPEQEGC